MASEAIFGESEAAPYLAEEKWAADPFTTSLKGLKSSARRTVIRIKSGRLCALPRWQPSVLPWWLLQSRLS
jgi:hypothetical protein